MLGELHEVCGLALGPDGAIGIGLCSGISGDCYRRGYEREKAALLAAQQSLIREGMERDAALRRAETLEKALRNSDARCKISSHRDAGVYEYCADCVDDALAGVAHAG